GGDEGASWGGSGCCHGGDAAVVAAWFGGCGVVGGGGRLEVSAALVVMEAAAEIERVAAVVVLWHGDEGTAAMVVHVDGGWWILYIGLRGDILGFAGKLFRRRQSVGDGGGWPTAAGGEGEKIIVCVFCVYNK
nr:hypothetical protein [Tanacetum cinerariifolium]